MVPRSLTSLLAVNAVAALAVGCAACAPSHPRLPAPTEAAAARDAGPRQARLAPTTVATTQAKDSPARGTEVAIPAGPLRVGSPTGAVYRDASREADAVPIELGAYHIDALPYPNDPAVPPQEEVPQAEAQALCAREGKRLCSELEWERACKGDEERVFPGAGDPFDPGRCRADAAACRSPFGVLSLGTLGREWTASVTTRGLGDPSRTAVVRGASTGAPLGQHRCAARDAATPDSRSKTLLFRCCRGVEVSVRYPEESERPSFASLALSQDRVASLLRGLPPLADVADSFRLFSQGDIDQSLEAAHSSRGRMRPWIAGAPMLAWSPVHGEEVWILSGDTPRGALLLAVYPLGQDRYRLIGSVETAREHVPFVLGYKTDAPRSVLFSTCWGCGGEGGAITLGENGRVGIDAR